MRQVDHVSLNNWDDTEVVPPRHSAVVDRHYSTQKSPARKHSGLGSGDVPFGRLRAGSTLARSVRQAQDALPSGLQRFTAVFGMRTGGRNEKY
jgi:hypothetical protein